MKHCIGLILLLFGCYGVYAQSPAPKVLISEADSMVVEMNKLFINPKNIKQIYVLKDISPEMLKNNRGAAFTIYLKKASRLVALNSIRIDSLTKKSPRVMYVVDGEHVADTVGVKIDILNIKKIDGFFTGDYPNLYVNQTGIVYLITTKSKGKKIKPLK